MPRDFKAYLSDIIGSINKIEQYTEPSLQGRGGGRQT